MRRRRMAQPSSGKALSPSTNLAQIANIVLIMTILRRSCDGERFEDARVLVRAALVGLRRLGSGHHTRSIARRTLVAPPGSARLGPAPYLRRTLSCCKLGS